MTHENAEEEAFASLGAAIRAYASVLRERLERDGGHGGATLPSSAQLVTWVLESAGLRDEVHTSRRTHQRQKAGEPTPRLGELPMRALARLILDAAQPGLALHELDESAVRAWLHEELGAAAESWDALAGAVAECAAPTLARQAALRAALMDLAVRRAAVAQRLGLRSCPTWFALERHPFDAALRLVLEWRRIAVRDVHRGLELEGVKPRTFESWRHERQVPPTDAPELLAKVVLRLSPPRPGRAAVEAQIVGLLRAGRAAKVLRRTLAELLEVDVLDDLFRGHQRIAEAAFDAFTVENLGASALVALFLMPKEEWLAHLKTQARFDPQARALLEESEGWVSGLVGRVTDDAARQLFAQLDAVPPEKRLDVLRALVWVGAADPEARQTLVKQLAPGTLDELIMMGPRARAFPILLTEIGGRLPWRHVVSDLAQMARDPRDHMLHTIARNDVLTALAIRAVGNGVRSEKLSGLAGSLLRFELTPGS